MGYEKDRRESKYDLNSDHQGDLRDLGTEREGKEMGLRLA